MNPSKKTKPATAETVNGPRKSEQLGSGLNLSNNPKPDQLQAPDDTESDLDFFAARPSVNERIRLPLPDEFSAAILSEARTQARGREVLVLVVIDRDARGRPSTRARGLVCLPGGAA
jgi:hypothetical protein